jgi:hypothetical protein
VVAELKGSADEAHLLRFKEAGSTLTKSGKTEKP